VTDKTTASTPYGVAERLAEMVDGFTPLDRESDVIADGPPHFFLRVGGQVLRVAVTAWTCRVCGVPLSEARTSLGLSLCSGACHRDAAAWYVRHEGAAFAKQYRKDEWSLAPTKPGPKPSDTGSVLVSLLLAVCIAGGLLGLLALGQAAMCATHTTPGERPVYCEPSTEGGER
jgi:hypothetical protein